MHSTTWRPAFAGAIWEQHPFKSTPIAEDLAWSLDVLRRGLSIAFAPNALVIHSHDRGAVYEYRRTRVLHEQLFELFGLQTIPAMPALIRAIATTSLSHARLELQSPRQWARALTLAVAWPLGQYVGRQTCGPPRQLARAPSTGHRLMRILIVSHGFPPPPRAARRSTRTNTHWPSRAPATRCWC